MKKIIFYSLMPVMMIIVFVAAQSPSNVLSHVPDDIDYGWPEEVMSLLEHSCFDCHTKDASNMKAKDALSFTEWGDYKLSKKIGKLNDISEKVKEKKMPPGKYIDKYPDKALSEEGIGVITNWANAEGDKLMED